MLLNYLFLLNFFCSLLVIKAYVCGDSIIEPGEQCDDGNANSNDGCGVDCKIESDYKCYQNLMNVSMCYINKPFSAYLQYIPLTNPFHLNLTFTKPFTFNTSFILSRMNLTISGLNSSNYDFSWNMKNTSNPLMFIIELSFNVSFTWQVVTIQFNNTDSLILDVFNEPLGTGSIILQAEIPLYIQYTSSEENFMYFMQYFIRFVFIIMVFCTIPLSILNSLTVFWSFLDIVQLIQLLEYVNYKSARQAIEFFRELRITNFFLNEYSYVFTIRSLDYHESDYLSQIFVDEELGTRYFQNSSLSVLIFFIAIFILILCEVFWLLSGKISRRLNFWMEKIRKKIKYSIVLRACLIIYTPISFATIMQFTNLNFDYDGNKLDSALSIIGLAYMIIFPLICFYILNSIKFNLENEEVKCAFETIYDSLQTNALLKKNFVIFYLIRKILWPLFIVIYADDPLYQMIGLISCIIVIITLLILKSPYKKESLNREFIFCEFLVLVVLVCIAVNVNLEYLGGDYLTLNIVVSLGWAIVAILSSIMFIKLVFMIYTVVNNISVLILKTKKIISSLNEPIAEPEPKLTEKPTFMQLEMSSYLQNNEEDRSRRKMNKENKDKIVFEMSENDDDEQL